MNPFAVTGVDFAGPIIYSFSGPYFPAFGLNTDHKINKNVGKYYPGLFTCNTTRVVHLELCKDLTIEEFKRTLKEFVARKGKPQMLVSDDGKRFVSASK